MEASGLYIRFIFSLFIVLGLIILCAWIMKHMKMRKAPWAASSKRLELIEKLMLDDKRCLVIVRVDAKEHALLLGHQREMELQAALSPLSPSLRLLKAKKEKIECGK